jgi:tripartite-type tricarboxylate transporter receptor subunit TctC
MMVGLRRALTVMTVAAVLGISIGAVGQNYPVRPVQLIVPFSPGTAVDAVARLLSVRLGESLKVPFVVDNRMGAAGQIGTQVVAKAAPDGYTLLFTSPAHYINASLYRQLPYDPVKDFLPIMRVSNAQAVLVVGKSAPVNSMEQLVDYIRARPGQVNFSSAGVGSTTHLPAALFSSMTGLDIVHVPYKSGAQAVTDVMNGEVFMTFTAVATALPFVKAGTLKAIGVTGASRSASLPDVPTIAEGGIAGYDFISWNALYAPAGTPEPIIAKLEQALLEIVRSPEFAKQMLANGVEL